MNAWNNSGLLHEGSKGDISGAEDAYRKVIASDQNHVKSWYNLGLKFQTSKGVISGPILVASVFSMWILNCFKSELLILLNTMRTANLNVPLAISLTHIFETMEAFARV